MQQRQLPEHSYVAEILCLFGKSSIKVTLNFCLEVEILLTFPMEVAQLLVVAGRYVSSRHIALVTFLSSLLFAQCAPFCGTK